MKFEALLYADDIVLVMDSNKQMQVQTVVNMSEPIHWTGNNVWIFENILTNDGKES